MRIHVYIYIYIYILYHVYARGLKTGPVFLHFVDVHRCLSISERLNLFHSNPTTFGTGKDRNPHVQKLSGGKGRESDFFETNGVNTWKNE